MFLAGLGKRVILTWWNQWGISFVILLYAKVCIKLKLSLPWTFRTLACTTIWRDVLFAEIFLTTISLSSIVTGLYKLFVIFILVLWNYTFLDTCPFCHLRYNDIVTDIRHLWSLFSCNHVHLFIENTVSPSSPFGQSFQSSICFEFYQRTNFWLFWSSLENIYFPSYTFLLIFIMVFLLLNMNLFCSLYVLKLGIQFVNFEAVSCINQILICSVSWFFSLGTF